MKTAKTWKLLLASALLLIAALSPRPARAAGGGDPCWYVCSYGAVDYCYYGDGCVPYCCRYDDWTCLNPCTP